MAPSSPRWPWAGDSSSRHVSVDRGLLARYVTGECTHDERASVEAWLAESSERRQALAAAIDAVQAADVWERPDVDRAWQDASRQIGIAPHEQRADRARRAGPSRRLWPQGTEQRGHGSWAGRFVLAAAAAVLIAGVVPVVVHVIGLRATTQPFREFATPAGSRSTVTLRDGTHLVLGPATRLRVPTDFGTSSRTVELDGQAYFAVVHNAAQPFAVRTTRAEVRDVGTTFSVRAYADDADGRVAVTEGKVRVGTASLARGDLAVIDGGGRVAVRHGVDLTPYIAWTQGRLAFDGTPLRDVARELDRAFDVRITIADSGLAGDPVSGTFDNESVDQVLDDITDVIGGDYERVGRAVAIHRRTSKATRHGLGERLYMRMAQVAAPKE